MTDLMAKNKNAHLFKVHLEVLHYFIQFLAVFVLVLIFGGLTYAAWNKIQDVRELMKAQKTPWYLGFWIFYFRVGYVCVEGSSEMKLIGGLEGFWV